MIENTTETSRAGIRAFEAEEWAEFRTILEGRFPEDPESIGNIEHAYYTAEKAHRNQRRKSGERYFSHPREAAVILLEAGVRSPRPIILALLHDVQEDQPNFFELAPGPGSRNYGSSWDRIEGSFDESIAHGLHLLTEPDHMIYGGKAAAEKEYHERFIDPGIWEDAGERFDNTLIYDVLLVKIADRLHNLRTLGAMPRAKQIAKIRETRVVYLPAFSRIPERYPLQGAILLGQLNSTISSLQDTLR